VKNGEGLQVVKGRFYIQPKSGRRSGRVGRSRNSVIKKRTFKNANLIGLTKGDLLGGNRRTITWGVQKGGIRSNQKASKIMSRKRKGITEIIREISIANWSSRELEIYR